MEKEKCCGTCKYHCRANDDGDWICENENSDGYMVWTDYDDECEEWEGKR